MEVAQITKDAVLVSLSKDELEIVNSVLNEVCHGLRVPEFEKRMGASMDEAESLLHGVGKLIDKIYRGSYEDDELMILVIEHGSAPRRPYFDFLINVTQVYRNEAQVSLSKRELTTISLAFGEVFREIDDVEFHTRIGVTNKEAEVLSNEIGDLIQQISSA